MKFALMEIKMALIRLVSHFEILKNENTPDCLEFVGDLISNLSAKNGINVVLKRRPPIRKDSLFTRSISISRENMAHEKISFS